MRTNAHTRRNTAHAHRFFIIARDNESSLVHEAFDGVLPWRVSAHRLSSPPTAQPAGGGGGGGGGGGDLRYRYDERDVAVFEGTVRRHVTDARELETTEDQGSPTAGYYIASLTPVVAGT